MQGLKSAILAIFQTGSGWPCPQESLAGFQKLFLLWVPMNSQQCWKAKLERAHSFRAQSGKITVCATHPNYCQYPLINYLNAVAHSIILAKGVSVL